jgi:hypothetical protein
MQVRVRFPPGALLESRFERVGFFLEFLIVGNW